MHFQGRGQHSVGLGYSLIALLMTLSFSLFAFFDCIYSCHPGLWVLAGWKMQRRRNMGESLAWEGSGQKREIEGG